MKSPVNRGGLRFYLVIFALITVFATPAIHATLRTVLYGAPLVLLGVALHLWAKGCLHQDREVTTTGPYRFVRHPFYTANALIDAGIVVMSGWWPWAIILPVWWLAVYIPVIRGEEKYLTSLYGDKYTEYKKRIWMLVPLSPPLPDTGLGFTWRNRNIAKGNEIPRDLKLIAYIPLLLAAAGVRIMQHAFFTGGHYVYVGAAVAFVALHIAAWLISRHVRHGGTLFGGPIDQVRPAAQ